MKKKSIKSASILLIRKSLQPYLDTDISKYISHVLISIIIGLLAGGGAIIFHHILYITRTFFRPDNFRAKFDIPVFFIILIPVTGAILTSLLTWFYPSTAKEKGVISVIKAIIIRKGFIPVKETLFHFIAPIISIGTGAAASCLKNNISCSISSGRCFWRFICTCLEYRDFSWISDGNYIKLYFRYNP